jgi:hypothetical protein
VNALWRRLTGTRTMRSVAAEFGPPPGARYAYLFDGMTDLDVIRRGHEIIAARRSDTEAAHSRVVAERSRLHRLAEVSR